MNAEQMTLSGYLKMYLKSMAAAYKGKRLLFTLGISVISGLLGFVLTVYVWPWLFSAKSVANQICAGIAVALAVMIILSAAQSVFKKDRGYWCSIGAGGALLMGGYFSGKTSSKDRMRAIVAAVAGGAAGVLLAPAFAVILSLWLFTDSAQQNGTVLTLAAAMQNSFNNKFRKNHRRNAKAMQRDFLSLAFGLFVGFVLRLILGLAGVM